MINEQDRTQQSGEEREAVEDAPVCPRSSIATRSLSGKLSEMSLPVITEEGEGEVAVAA
jgi:hypothetical protein